MGSIAGCKSHCEDHIKSFLPNLQQHHFAEGTHVVFMCGMGEAKGEGQGGNKGRWAVQVVVVRMWLWDKRPGGR